VLTHIRVRGRSLALATAAACVSSIFAVLAAAPAAGDATVTIAGAGGEQRVGYGESVTVAGRTGRTAAGHTVRVEYATSGGGFRPVGSTRSAGDGSFSFALRPRHSGAYRAVSGGHATTPRRVTVVARLSGRSSHHVHVGARVRVRGALRPGLRGRRVALQLRRHGHWSTVSRARTRRGGRFTARWRASRPGGFRLRVRFGGDGANAAVSATLRGRVYVYRPAQASWYSGGRTACGKTASIAGVAHKTLPCGTRVRFRYHGHSAVLPVIDRGPFAGGREWDLTAAAKRKLHFGSTGTVWTTR
jgi:peptidoglycan lytic transglycosylase